MPNRYSNATLPPFPGISQLVEVTGPTRLVFLSGQIGSGPDGKVVGAPGDFKAQAAQVYENVRTALADAGGGFEHIVKATNYLLDIKHMPLLREVRARYVGDNRPAGTLVVISALADPAALLEVDVIAAIPG